MKAPGRVRELILCALFAALTAAFSQIAIPMEPVPINLATLSVFLAGAILGPKLGCVSQCVYVLLGAVGAPVFSMFRGGIGVLLGPTGGYIFGYIAAAWLVGFIARGGKNRLKASRLKASRLWVLAFAMVAGFFAYMSMGTLWYMLTAGVPFMAALSACVLPFLPGDALKVVSGALLADRLIPLLEKGGHKAP